MARRGDELREHILRTAKDVFLEFGFERASMDEVASRAETSKRSLYAHFESKEKLFLDVIEFVRGLVLLRLKSPQDYPGTTEDALVAFFARYLEIFSYKGSVQFCRVCMAEAERFPDGSSSHFDVIFSDVEERVGAYLRNELGLKPRASTDAARHLIGRILYPTFPRLLFGKDKPLPHISGVEEDPTIDTKPVRAVVRDVLATFS